MSKPSLVEIPVKRHVRQFLLREFGREPIKLHQSTWIGKLTIPYLERKNFKAIVPRPAKLSDINIKLMLTARYKHLQMTDDNRRLLSDLLEKYLLQQMFSYIKALTSTGQFSEFQAIRSFRDFYDLDADTFDIENMRKAWRDHKANLEKIQQAEHALEEELEARNVA